MSAMTIDQALRVLQDAKRKMGGDRCLILSLSGSGIEDANVNSMHIACDTKGESGYVEVRVSHPSLRVDDKRVTPTMLPREAAYRAAEFIEQHSNNVLGEHERALLSQAIRRILKGE